MSSELYEVLALGMRYWFVLLGLLIVIRAYGWLIGEHRRRHRRLHDLPDAGTVGDLKLLEDCGDLEEGTTFPLSYEGTLGYLRTCDITVPCDGVAPQHLDFSFRRGKGLLIMPRRGLSCTADGEELTGRSRPGDHPLRHGSILEVGEAKFRVRLFAGLETGGSCRLQDEPEDEELPENGAEQTEDTAAAAVRDVPPEQPVLPREAPPEWTAQQHMREEPRVNPAADADAAQRENSRRIAELFGSEEDGGRRRSMWRRNDDEEE